jgi:hypothetical protein
MVVSDVAVKRCFISSLYTDTFQNNPTLKQDKIQVMVSSREQRDVGGYL